MDHYNTLIILLQNPSQGTSAVGKKGTTAGGVLLGYPFLLFVVAWLLGCVTYGVAGFVFAITSLIQADNSQQDGAQSSAPCEWDMTRWFIIYGAFGVGIVFVHFVCWPVSILAEEEGFSPLAKAGHGFAVILGLFNFCWICYGVHLQYTNGGNYEACSAGLYYWFYITTMFLFWLAISIIGGAIVIAVCAPCALPTVVDKEDVEAAKNPKPAAQMQQV